MGEVYAKGPKFVGAVRCGWCGWVVRGVEARTENNVTWLLEQVFEAHRLTGGPEGQCYSSWDARTILNDAAKKGAVKPRARGKRLGKLRLIRGRKSLVPR